MISKSDELIINVLITLVESVSENPRRILFKGVADLSDSFTERMSQKGYFWRVMVTGKDKDIVGARNDASIDTLVIFYRSEVGERESLNAFRIYDENAIANSLIPSDPVKNLLPDNYNPKELSMLNSLLSLVYPSVDRLADFLCKGKDLVGEALPFLGLFHDPQLSYSSDLRQWNSRLEDNFTSASLRWHDFVDRSLRGKEARRLLGNERVSMIRQSETEPSVRSKIFSTVTFDEAIQVLNPPTALENSLMLAGLRRENAAELVREIKNGTIDPLKMPAGTPTLPGTLIEKLLKIGPKKEVDEEGSEKESELKRVDFCLEALLRLAQSTNPLPRQIKISREDLGPEIFATIEMTSERKLDIDLPSETARLLSTPKEGSSELVFFIWDQKKPETILSTFSLENRTGRFDSYMEIWPDEAYWEQASQLDPKHADVWLNLRNQAQLLLHVVDPDWQKEQDEGNVEASREPNNQVYLIFDLLYLANRQVFEDYLDAWLDAATLSWRSTSVAEKKEQWTRAIEGLLKLGLAQHTGQDSIAVLPFHPARLIWHRAVISRIEGWLFNSITNCEPLVFEASVLSDQMEASDRPHMVYLQKKRYLESYHAPFVSLFVPDFRRQRVRAPIDRARQKIEQFGRMWPFSLSRLHIAFQPGDASDEVYSLLAQHADKYKESAFNVRAVLENTAEMTSFDQQLFSSGDETTDLLTQEYHESLMPRVEYSKDNGVVINGNDSLLETHVALLVDAFREEEYNFTKIVGKINNQPHWTEFGKLLENWGVEARNEFKKVDLSIPAFHMGTLSDQKRDIVYVPLSGNRPEYMQLLYDSLCSWMYTGDMTEGAYYERVVWDEQSLIRLHDQADWVILFDRTLDKAFFQEQLKPAGIKLIDFYPRLPGGYRLSVSSKRIVEVEWQMVQVLRKMFTNEELDLRVTAEKMLDALGEFASGLLLKTLGGGSLAQELLGLYATYLSLITEQEFCVGKDWLIPLDNYQEWFGRRTQKGRRADLLLLRTPEPNTLELLAVESKWYKQLKDSPFVFDEFGRDGQMHTAVHSLSSLFDPTQNRLDKDYWQKTLYSLLDEAPSAWDPFRQAFQTGKWQLKVDGIVYVHQYSELNQVLLLQRSQRLNLVAQKLVCEDQECFGLGSEFQRLRLISRPEIIQLFKQDTSL